MGRSMRRAATTLTREEKGQGLVKASLLGVLGVLTLGAIRARCLRLFIGHADLADLQRTIALA